MAGGRPSMSGPYAAAEAGGAGDWFAVSDRGDCALRLLPGLVLGETPEGTLVLDDPSPECRWLRFEPDPRAGLRVRPVAADWQLAADGEILFACLLHAGLTLALPGNTLRISRNIEPPREDGEVVEVVWSVDREGPGEPAVTEPARAPALRAEPRVRPAAKNGRPRRWSGLHAVALGLVVAAALLALIKLGGGSVLEAAQRAAGAAGAPEAVAPAPQAAPAAGTLPPPQPAPRQAPGPGTPTAAPGAAQRPRTDVADAGPDGSIPARPAPESDAWQPAAGPAVQSAPAAGRGDQALARQPGGDRADAGLEDRTPAQPDPPPVSGQAAAELARAAALLEAGRITYPPGDNAVGVLVALVQADPGNQRALDLLGVCTTRLIDQAVAARAAGRDFEARNLLEEVLGFNPEHPGANALWEEWLGAPR